MFQMGVFKLACSYFLCSFWYFAYAIYFRLKRLETDKWKIFTYNMPVNAVKLLCNNLYLNNKCIRLNVQRIGPLQEIWLTGNLTNHNAESAIFVRQTRPKPQQGKPATFSQKSITANTYALAVCGKGDQRPFGLNGCQWRISFTTMNKQLFRGNGL